MLPVPSSQAQDEPPAVQMQDVADMERLTASCCSDCSPEVAREVLGLGLTALLECGTEV